jgi:riboflavin synthase
LFRFINNKKNFKGSSMFTGIIEAICTVKTAVVSAGAMKLTVDLAAPARGCKTGDSIAVNGVCLTITKITGTIVDFDISGETLAKTTLGSLRAGAFVNIERALAADGRFGGHFVLGHINGTATIKSIEKKGQFSNMTFAADKELLDNMIGKGSVAVDGISLTVAKLNKDSFTVALIPETLNRTILGKAKLGDKVNIETDCIVKAVKKHLEQILPKQDLTIEKLQELGF